MSQKPDCYKCVHRLSVPGDAHSRCNNISASVSGNPHGIKKGWFIWPLNFDPVWLESCDGFSDDPNDKRDRVEYNPLLELFALLK
jgi:hypothetical protein